MCIRDSDKEMLKKRMAEIADKGEAELILTTGGTGFSPRDVMPEATEEICERRVPGIPEAMRAYSMTITKRAMLSLSLIHIYRSLRKAITETARFSSALFTNPVKCDRIFTYENSWKKRVHLYTALQRNPVW